MQSNPLPGLVRNDPPDPSCTSVLPNCSLYVCPTILTPLPSLRGQCKLILLCIKRHAKCARPLLLLSHNFHYPSICLYLRPSISLIPRIKRYLCHINRISPLHAHASPFPFLSNYILPPIYFSRCRVLCDGGLKLRTTSRLPATNPGGRLCGGESWRGSLMIDCACIWIGAVAY